MDSHAAEMALGLASCLDGMPERSDGLYRSASEVLGVGAGASDEQIRTIYLERVRQSPPERDPEGFKEVRRAYGVLKDGARRRELDLSLYKRDSGLGVGMGSVGCWPARIFG